MPNDYLVRYPAVLEWLGLNAPKLYDITFVLCGDELDILKGLDAEVDEIIEKTIQKPNEQIKIKFHLDFNKYMLLYCRIKRNFLVGM